MLTCERIKEAENNVKNYFNDNLLYKVKESNIEIKKIYIKNAKESLKMANIALTQDISALWCTVCSYYAMFYYANALLYHYWYKVGDKIAHKVTSDSLIALVREKLKKSILENYEELEKEAQEFAQLKSETIIENFDFERGKRNKYQYSTSDEIKFSKGKTSFQRAKEFVYLVEEILNNIWNFFKLKINYY